MESAEDRRQAKALLRERLKQFGGDPSHPEVVSALDHLVSLNPYPAPTKHFDLIQGNWKLISAPSFPDGDRQSDGIYVYSLGRLAFNMFQPKDLKVVIEAIEQPILPLETAPQHTHHIEVQFKTVSPDSPSLRGKVINLGLCEPDSDSSIQVKFTGGILEPLEETERAQWNDLFGEPRAEANYSLKERLEGVILKILFGLVPPTEMEDDGRVVFQMKRSPKGSLKILYLDEDLRITRGKKESFLICERLPD